MSISTGDLQQINHDLIDVSSLALSTSKARAVILHDEDQFSKASEDHLIELTQFDSTADPTPMTQVFTNEFQLSQYLCSSAPSVPHPSPSIEI
jgi:hypothetical protein